MVQKYLAGQGRDSLYRQIRKAACEVPAGVVPQSTMEDAIDLAMMEFGEHIAPAGGLPPLWQAVPAAAAPAAGPTRCWQARRPPFGHSGMACLPREPAAGPPPCASLLCLAELQAVPVLGEGCGCTPGMPPEA